MKCPVARHSDAEELLMRFCVKQMHRCRRHSNRSSVSATGNSDENGFESGSGFQFVYILGITNEQRHQRRYCSQIGFVICSACNESANHSAAAPREVALPICTFSMLSVITRIQVFDQQLASVNSTFWLWKPDNE